MLNPKWSITLVLVTVTTVVVAISALALRPDRALAQTSVDCQILWTTDDDYRQLATGTANLVATGYSVSGFAASEDYLYTLACRK